MKNAIRFSYSQILQIWHKGPTDKVREPYFIWGFLSMAWPCGFGVKEPVYTPDSLGPAHLVPGLCWCSDGKTQAKNHARGLGNDADHVEGGGRLVWGTEEKWQLVSSPRLAVNEFRRK